MKRWRRECMTCGKVYRYRYKRGHILNAQRARRRGGIWTRNSVLHCRTCLGSVRLAVAV